MARNEIFGRENEAPLLNPFTWSLRRREMLDRCPREYFLHYYGSVGGAFLKIGSRQAELLHLLRNMEPLPVYVKRLIYTTVRQLFISGSQELSAFKETLRTQFFKEYRDMLLGKAEQDHKVPLLCEMTQRGFSPQVLKERVLDALLKEAEILERCALKQLLEVAPEKRLELPFALKVVWGELDTYCPLIAAWFDGGRFNALCTGSASEENSALIYFYALNRLGCGPDRVIVRHLEKGVMCEAPPLNSCSAAFRRIRKDVERMLLLEKRSAGRDAKFFPQEFDNCAQCRFCLFCSRSE